MLQNPLKKRKLVQNWAAYLKQQENDVTSSCYYLGCDDSLAASSPPHGLRSCQATPMIAYRGTRMRWVMRSVVVGHKNAFIRNTANTAPHNTAQQHYLPCCGGRNLLFLGSTIPRGSAFMLPARLVMKALWPTASPLHAARLISSEGMDSVRYSLLSLSYVCCMCNSILLQVKA